MNKSLRQEDFLLCAFGASLDHAGLFEDDEARRAILDLRQRVETNRQEVDQRASEQAARVTEDNAQLRRSVLDLQNQIEALRADMARLVGQNEQLARDVAELQRQQKDALESLDQRLQKFEPSKVIVDGREFLADPAEKRDFDAALGVFRKGDFPGAQAAFVDFIKRYPTSG